MKRLNTIIPKIIHASQLTQGKGVPRNRLQPDAVGSSAIRSDDSQSPYARGSHTRLEHVNRMGPYLD